MPLGIFPGLSLREDPKVDLTLKAFCYCVLSIYCVEEIIYALEESVGKLCIGA